MTECIHEESLELDEDYPPAKNWAESMSRIDLSQAYCYDPDLFNNVKLQKYPKLVPVITTRDLEWYQQITNANGHRLINGFDEIMVNIYGECSPLFDYHRYASDKILTTQDCWTLWIDNGAFQLFQSEYNGRTSKIPSDPIIRFKHQFEIIRKTHSKVYNVILPDYVQDFPKSQQSYELLLNYIWKISPFLKKQDSFFIFRLTVQGTSYKEFRQAGQSIRAILKDSKYENFPFHLAVSFPLHEFKINESHSLLKDVFHLFNPRFHEIPFNNRPRLHLLGETRKNIVKYAHQLNEEYRTKYKYGFQEHQIESFDTSRPYFIADEVICDPSFAIISHQYMKWANLFQHNYQPNLLFYASPQST